MDENLKKDLLRIDELMKKYGFEKLNKWRELNELSELMHVRFEEIKVIMRNRNANN